PDGPARTRAAATARTVRVLMASPDPDRFATTLAPGIEFIDHRPLGFPPRHGAEQQIEGYRSYLGVATDIALGVGGRLTLEPDRLLVRWTERGTARASGGTYERQFLMLWIFGSDALVIHNELFAADREAEALARLDALTGKRATDTARRVRPNAATA